MYDCISFQLNICGLFSQLGNMLTEIYQNCPSYRDFCPPITVNVSVVRLIEVSVKRELTVLSLSLLLTLRNRSLVSCVVKFL